MNPLIRRGEKTRFMCTRCGRCCSSGPNVALTVMDVCRIAKYVGSAWKDLAGKYFYVVIADYIPVLVLRGISNKCVFLKTQGGKATCTIYPARPARCRLYPFMPITPGKVNELEVSSRCPGIGLGDSIEPPWSELEDYVKEAREHYAEIFDLIFNKNHEPLKAVEALLDKLCSR